VQGVNVKRLRGDSGATAVEFALVMLPLLLLLMGVIDFGLAFHTKLSMSAAAREGVRVMAISNDAAKARTTIRNAAGPSVSLTDAQIFVTSTCTAGANAEVTITFPVQSLTGFFAEMVAGETIQTRAEMRCGG
jgi:Flp pilus assembly protein TadG